MRAVVFFFLLIIPLIHTSCPVGSYSLTGDQFPMELTYNNQCDSYWKYKEMNNGCGSTRFPAYVCANRNIYLWNCEGNFWFLSNEQVGSLSNGYYGPGPTMSALIAVSTNVKYCTSCPPGTYAPTAGQFPMEFIYNNHCDSYWTYKEMNNGCGSTPFPAYVCASSNYFLWNCEGNFWVVTYGVFGSFQNSHYGPSPTMSALIAASTNIKYCGSCYPGTYAPTSGLSTCQSCGVGNYGTTTGLTSCTSSCNPGESISPAGCVTCAAGTFNANSAWPTAITSCNYNGVCKSGRWAVHSFLNNLPVFQCVSLTYKKYYFYYGRYDGWAVCQDSIDHPYCSGVISAEKSISGLLSGTGCGYDVSPCSNCPTGTYGATTGMSACTACEIGSFNGVVGQTACTKCASGSVALSTGSAGCPQCRAGTYTDASNPNTCLLCPEGSTSAVGAFRCSTCGIGTYASSSGSPVCVQCQTGSYNTALGSIYPMELTISNSYCQNTWKFINMCNGYPQYQCGRYYFINSISNNQFYSSVWGISNLICDTFIDLTFKYAWGTSQTWSTFNSKTTNRKYCYSCPAGQIGASTGLSACSNCVAGSTSVIGSSVCTNCVAGMFTSTAGSAPCQQCSAGRYNTMPKATGCFDCLAGFTSVPGSTSCTICNRGTFGPTPASSLCQSCVAGLYSNMEGSSACLACSVGQSSVTGSSFCTNCSAGQHSPINGGVCTNCSANQYSLPAASVCVLCPAGKASPSGSSACFDCAGGKFSSGPGLSCIDCPANQYSSSGSSACLLCPPGKFSLSSSSTCSNCSAGKFSTTSGVPCQTCPLGTTSSSGDTQCLPCTAGTFGNTLGLCNPCDAGTYNNNTGFSMCYPCFPSTYANLTSQTTCLLCETGRYSTGLGTTFCSICSASTYAPSPGSTACLACPPFTGSFMASSACVSCAV